MQKRTTNDKLLAQILAAVKRDWDFIDMGEAAPYMERVRNSFAKWRLIHKYVHAHPFSVSAGQPRSSQWREALTNIRHLEDTELIDWVLLQAEVAGHLEQGIQDLRPRKSGPCHPLLLEYVSNRKRHALAVLHFAEAGEKEGIYTVNSSWHAKTAEILGKQHSPDDRTSGGHEGVPWEDKGE